MRVKFVLLSLLFSIAINLKAEEAFFADLFGLTYECPIIFTARMLSDAEFTAMPLNDKNGQSPITNLRRFVIIDRIKIGETLLPDTIQICSWEYYRVDNRRNWRTGEEEPFSIDSFQVFVFFGEYHIRDKYQVENSFLPLSSGIRAFRADSMFVASQQENPGPYHFQYAQKISLSDFIKKIHRTIARLDNLLQMRQISPVSKRNKSILEWAETHVDDLKSSQSSFIGYEGDSEENWGVFKWKVFEWIYESEIWQDIWKAMEISSIIYDEDYGSYFFSYKPERGSNAFANKEARLFLCRKIKDNAIAPKMLYPTLDILDESLQRWINGAPILIIDQQEQKEIIISAVAVLDQKEYSVSKKVLQIIDAAGFSKNLELPFFYDDSVLYQLQSSLLLGTDNPLKEILINLIEKMKQSKK